MSRTDEFQFFLQAPEEAPSLAVSETVQRLVYQAIYPSVWRVFGKLVRIHIFSGAVTLFFCPQFGVGPIGGMGLMHLFARWGHSVCSLLCGGLFLGITSLMARFLLNRDELRVARRAALWQMTLLVTLSIAVLMLIGTATGSLALPTLGHLTLWGLGAIGAASLVMKLGVRSCPRTASSL
ncbi:MAG: hypothetical protein HYZ71_14515 [Deltaproteobacteria bacterium]|nr:hypothetical protein [Deltaproteobacteria bacterium]